MPIQINCLMMAVLFMNEAPRASLRGDTIETLRYQQEIRFWSEQIFEIFESHLPCFFDTLGVIAL